MHIGVSTQKSYGLLDPMFSYVNCVDVRSVQLRLSLHNWLVEFPDGSIEPAFEKHFLSLSVSLHKIIIVLQNSDRPRFETQDSIKHVLLGTFEHTDELLDLFVWVICTWKNFYSVF